jgi:hypothetical protein
VVHEAHVIRLFVYSVCIDEDAELLDRGAEVDHLGAVLALQVGVLKLQADEVG